jgi:hypothetical protein
MNTMIKPLIDITKPVETINGYKVTNLRRFIASPGVYWLEGTIGADNGLLWRLDGARWELGDKRYGDLRNVPEELILDWSNLDQYQFASGQAHPFTYVATTTAPGKYPVIAMEKNGHTGAAYTLTGKDCCNSRYDLVRKPRKVTRTLYFAKAHIDAIEKGKSQYCNNAYGDVAVKVEYEV